ncbi:cuticle protein 7-like [Macrosteles quadrilineatus]|uniref:cuticle protein 7-like n=1 Tax=Macrosteles quadrilineatus TaxID=74068 RepID=UPI0023E2DBF6|nr:cuticle protein 7-like [Macrosteles quadrilineatus]
MALKIVLASCLLAAVSAQYAPKPYAPAPYAPKPYAPAPYAAKYAEPEPYDPNPQYNFEYSVHDDSTYDIKSQHEERNGDYVKGSYELYEPDGTKRIVEYSDDGYGFQAVVHKEGGKAYAPAPYAAKPYAPAPYAPKPYAPAPYAPKPYAPAPYAPKPYAPAPYAPAPYAPKPYAPAPSYSGYYKKPAY